MNVFAGLCYTFSCYTHVGLVLKARFICSVELSRIIVQMYTMNQHSILQTAAKPLSANHQYFERSNSTVKLRRANIESAIH